MTPKLVEPRDDARAAERGVAFIANYAVRFDPVDRTFYSGASAGSLQLGRVPSSDACADDTPES